jgi:signal transduction histidine kinase/CheY-like chemotaxis protein
MARPRWAGIFGSAPRDRAAPASDRIRGLADRAIAALSRNRPKAWVRYAVCVFLVLLCAVVRTVLPFPGIPYLLFVPAVFTVSLMFGAGAGLFVTALSAFMAAWLFLGAPYSLAPTPERLVPSALYVLFGGFISLVCDAVRRSALGQEAELTRYRALEAAAAASARALGESEARLADERARLAALVEHLPVGVCLLAPSGALLISNPAYRRLDPDGEIITVRAAGSRWIAWDPRGTRPSPDDHPVARVLRGESETGAEFLALADPNGPAWARITGVPLRGPDGEIIAALIVVADIDDEKRAEQALRRLNESLRLRVSERTAELESAQEALRQAQKMEVLGQLTGGIAHDFNNHLAAMTGSLEMTERRILDARPKEAVRYIAAAQGAAARAAALTQRLLAFSRRHPPAPRSTDAGDLVAGLEELIRRTVGPAIEVRVASQAGLWPTLVDPHQLENAVLNLCVNARDAMPGGGRLTIETANAAAETAAGEGEVGDYVAVRVTDTGAGMAPDTLARVFEPFFTTKPVGHGTGLGLSMIHGFVRQSGGRVTIRSAVGEGTAVTLELPRHHGGPAASQAPRAARPSGAAGEGRTVLVVDDEATVRMVLADVLASAGHRVLEAGDGPAAVALIDSAGGVDLLITDIGLPGGMNGHELAVAARRLSPGLKVLFITGYADLAGRDILPDEIDEPILIKPFALDTLSATVEGVISR